MDNFTTLWSRLQLRVPAAGPDLCRDLIRDAFNQLVERRLWSWRVKSGTFYPTSYTPITGTISTTNGSAVITGTGTNFSPSMIGYQFRVGNFATPTYTIVRVTSSTSLVLDRVWSGPSSSGYQYSIYQVYVTVPDDFDYFYSVTNPSANYRLNFNVSQAELDSYDPQRTQAGLAFGLAFLDFTPNYEGAIGNVVQVVGSGPGPISTTANGYSYPLDSIYSVVITVGGPVGIAQFSWRQDSGTTSSAGLTSSTPIDLSNGVQVYFPAATYNAGDAFAFQCKADTTSGLARYEMWPRPVDNTNTYPFLYCRRLPDLSDDNPQLPPRVAQRGDVLIEMALERLSLWPGTADAPNAYRDIGVSKVHQAKAETMIYELEKLDNEISMKDLAWTMPYMGPWRDGSWLQTHATYE